MRRYVCPSNHVLIVSFADGSGYSVRHSRPRLRKLVEVVWRDPMVTYVKIVNGEDRPVMYRTRGHHD